MLSFTRAYTAAGTTYLGRFDPGTPTRRTPGSQRSRFRTVLWLTPSSAAISRKLHHSFAIPVFISNLRFAPVVAPSPVGRTHASTLACRAITDVWHYGSEFTQASENSLCGARSKRQSRRSSIRANSTPFSILGYTNLVLVARRGIQPARAPQDGPASGLPPRSQTCPTLPVVPLWLLSGRCSHRSRFFATWWEIRCPRRRVIVARSRFVPQGTTWSSAVSG